MITALLTRNPCKLLYIRANFGTKLACLAFLGALSLECSHRVTLAIVGIIDNDKPSGTCLNSSRILYNVQYQIRSCPWLISLQYLVQYRDCHPCVKIY